MEIKVKTRVSAVITVGVIAAVFLGIPFNLELTPERHLRVIDSNGRPIQNALVRQIWDQHSLGKSFEAEVKTNDKGQIYLPRRTVRTSIFSLIVGGIGQIKKYGVHASFQSTEDIFVIVHGFPDHIYFGARGLEDGTAKLKRGPLDKPVIVSEGEVVGPCFIHILRER